MAKAADRLRHISLLGTPPPSPTMAPHPEEAQDEYGYEPMHSRAVFRFLCCSTAHIRPRDNEILLRESSNKTDRLIVDRVPHGYWILVPDRNDYNDEFRQSLLDYGYSLGMLRVLDMAVDQQCVWVRLDPAGPRVATLPQFDW